MGREGPGRCVPGLLRSAGHPVGGGGGLGMPIRTTRHTVFGLLTIGLKLRMPGFFGWIRCVILPLESDLAVVMKMPVPRPQIRTRTPFTVLRPLMIVKCIVVVCPTFSCR